MIRCEIGNINIQHTDPIEINTDIHLPLKDDKLVKLQESDPHTKQLRKQWENKNLDQNTYAMENNILKRKLINNGLLYTPIVVPDVLKDCLLILAHDKQGHNGFRRTYTSLKNRYHWKGMKKSENPKFLRTNDGMINVGLMTKLYNIVAHNLNEARKARDGKKKGITPKEPKKLKIGDNILVRDHTSKAFQPKYKDFCIVGLLGKNQVEIKDNHGHITKVHCRDIKKIPMTEKVCKLYEEEQTGKTREGRNKAKQKPV